MSKKKSTTENRLSGTGNRLPKAYEAKKYEDEIYKLWEESGAFQPDESSTKKPFTITMPPPNATGQLHLGHSVMLAIEDIMIRHKRMQGHPALWVPGTDHAGIATQNKVERDLKEEGKTRHDLGRKKFVKRTADFVANSQDTIRNQTRRMGASCDWNREYYSLDDSLTRTVYTTFKKMFDEGLIYRGNRIVNWCTRCHSSISDEEVDYVETKSKFYYFKYGPFEIGTARPETKYGDHVVVVHPDDERYKKYHGQKIEVDWLADEPIIATVFADEASDMEMGSGVMTITPAHSFIDFDLAQLHGFEVTQMINELGEMTEANGPHAGIKVEDARETYVQILKKKGLINRIDEEYVNQLSVCSRCKTPIQPLVSKQWFIDVNHPVDSWDHENLKLEKGRAYSLKEVMQHVVHSGQIEIIPSRKNKSYFQWIDNLRDWCISRQLWWGHQIPVWYNQSNPDDVFVGADHDLPKGKDWVRDEDTLDTWFSAGLFTFSPLKWIDDGEDFKKYHPTQVLETGYDILFFWVARMILMTTYMTGQVPFEKVYLHGMIRTRDGAKMSKSHPETCIDPLDMVEDFGADALRLSLFVGSTPGNDTKLYKEKIAGYRNFVNKLWNVSRYILMSVDDTSIDPKDRPKCTTLADRWIVTRLNQMIESTSRKLEAYDFSNAAEDLYQFTWAELADWYLEITKVQRIDKQNHNSPLFKGETGQELATDQRGSEGAATQSLNQAKLLLYVLRKLLILWHPFIPYITEEIWKHLNQPQLLISTAWPETNIDLIEPQSVDQFKIIRDIITAIREWRADFKVEAAKKIPVTVKISDTKLIKENSEIIKHLARLSQLKVEKQKEGGFTLKVEEIERDSAKEKERLEKEKAEKEKDIVNLERRMNNKGYMKKAPKGLVQKTVDQLQKRKAELKNIIAQLANLS